MWTIVLAPLSLLAVLPTGAGAQSSPLTLTAGLESPVPEGQPVVLTLSLHNDGPESLIVGGSAFEPSSFQITATDGEGHPVPRTAFGDRVLTRPMAVSANATVVIGPGQTLRYRFNLARLFDLSRRGLRHECQPDRDPATVPHPRRRARPRRLARSPCP